MPKKYGKIDDPLFESLPNYDKVYIQVLLDALQRGQLDVREKLILQLLALCKVILQKRLYKNPALQRSIADLIGTLMLRTCTWVDELCQPTKCVPTPKYYCQIIKNEINNFNTDDTNPNVTGNWLRKQYKNGQVVPERVKLREELLQVNPTLALELEDALLTLAETDREREIIVLRFQGFNDYDIAEQLQCSQPVIWEIRTSLEKRYDEYLQRESLK